MTEKQITITCRKCETQFEAESDWWKLCEPCSEIREAELIAEKKLEAEQKLAQAIADSRQQVENCMRRITPPRWSATSTTDQRFNVELWQRVEQWKPSEEQPWLGLVGEAGSCKTRIAFLKAQMIGLQMAEKSAAQRMIDKGRWRDLKIEETNADEFQQTARNLTSREKVTALTATYCEVKTSVSSIAAARINELKMADILIFDELGKLASSDAVSAAAFALIDYRHRNNSVTLWTSNLPPEKFCALWPEEFAVPSAGRIVQTSTIFKV
jgi:hypothetical protein